MGRPTRTREEKRKDLLTAKRQSAAAASSCMRAETVENARKRTRSPSVPACTKRPAVNPRACECATGQFPGAFGTPKEKAPGLPGLLSGGAGNRTLSNTGRKRTQSDRNGRKRTRIRRLEREDAPVCDRVTTRCDRFGVPRYQRHRSVGRGWRRPGSAIRGGLSSLIVTSTKPKRRIVSRRSPAPMLLETGNIAIQGTGKELFASQRFGRRTRAPPDGAAEGPSGAAGSRERFAMARAPDG